MDWYCLTILMANMKYHPIPIRKYFTSCQVRYNLGIFSHYYTMITNCRETMPSFTISATITAVFIVAISTTGIPFRRH